MISCAPAQGCQIFGIGSWGRTMGIRREGIGNPGANRAGRALANEVMKLGAIDCGHCCLFN